MNHRHFYVLMAVVALVLLCGFIIAYDDGNDFNPTLPVVSIETEDGDPIVSKDTYLDCSVTVSNSLDIYNFSDAPAEIRGRGNSTWDVPSYWYMPKKPYRLSFDAPVDLFGNGSATDWTLIANYTDQSLSRDLYAYSIGDCIGSSFTTSTQCVNLYLNGTYQGLYLVCEQIEIGDGRVEIESDYRYTDTGYLVEMDATAPGERTEGVEYFRMSDDLGSRCYRIRDMGRGNWTDDNFAFVSMKFNAAWEALHSGDYSRMVQYIDTDSFARTYIVNELFHTQDIADASFFMYTVGGSDKIYSGPIWDFDNSSGNATNLVSKDPDKLWACDENPWYHALLQYPEFREEVCTILADRSDDIRSCISDLTGYIISKEVDFQENFVKWPVVGALTGSNPLEALAITEWENYVYYVRDWLLESLSHLNGVYS